MQKKLLESHVYSIHCYSMLFVYYAWQCVDMGIHTCFPPFSHVRLNENNKSAHVNVYQHAMYNLTRKYACI